MLNPVQIHILKIFLNDLFDEDIFKDITQLHPRCIIAALEAVLERNTSNSTGGDADALLMQSISIADLKEIIKQLLDILRHECPQNRTASSVQVPQNEQGIDLGYVYFRNSSDTSELQCEKRGLFGLTARNDPKYLPFVERSDVVYFVRERVEQELQLQRARLQMAEYFETRIAQMDALRIQEEEFEKQYQHIDAAVRDGNVSEAIELSASQPEKEEQLDQRIEETMLKARKLLTRRVLQHHVRGREEASQKDLALLETIESNGGAAGKTSSFCVSLRREIRITQLLKQNVENLTAEEIVKVIDEMPSGGNARLSQLLLKLAKLHEREGDASAAAKALCQAVTLLTVDHVDEDVISIFKTLDAKEQLSFEELEPLHRALSTLAEPVPIACYRLAKHLKQAGILDSSHQNILDMALKSDLSPSMKCEMLTSKIALSSSILGWLAIFEDLKNYFDAIPSALIYELFITFPNNCFRKHGVVFEVLLRRADLCQAKIAHVHFLLGGTPGLCTDDDKIKHYRAALRLGYNRADCLIGLTRAISSLVVCVPQSQENTLEFTKDEYKREAERCAFEALQLNLSPNQLAQALLAMGRVVLKANVKRVLGAFRQHFDSLISQQEVNHDTITKLYEAYIGVLIQAKRPSEAKSRLFELKMHMDATKHRMPALWNLIFLHEKELDFSFEQAFELFDFMHTRNHVWASTHSVKARFCKRHYGKKPVPATLRTQFEQWIRCGLAVAIADSSKEKNSEQHVLKSTLINFLYDTGRTGAALQMVQEVLEQTAVKQHYIVQFSCLVLRARSRRANGSNKKAMQDLQLARQMLKANRASLLENDVFLLFQELSDMLWKQGNLEELIEVLDEANEKYQHNTWEMERMYAQAHFARYVNSERKDTEALDVAIRSMCDCAKSTDNEPDIVLSSQYLIEAKRYNEALKALSTYKDMEQGTLAITNMFMTMLEASANIEKSAYASGITGPDSTGTTANKDKSSWMDGVSVFFTLKEPVSCILRFQPKVWNAPTYLVLAQKFLELLTEEDTNSSSQVKKLTKKLSELRKLVESYSHQSYYYAGTPFLKFGDEEQTFLHY